MNLKIRHYLLTGLLVWLPMGVTVWLLTWLAGTMDGIFLAVLGALDAVIPGMRERRWGRIINFTGTTEPRMLNATFSAKASVHIWAKSLSREVGADPLVQTEIAEHIENADQAAKV